jgi:threonine aldolase
MSSIEVNHLERGKRKLIDLRSDTVTKPSPEMREWIARAEVGDDVFGDDPTVKRLEEMVAGLLGKETALYFPSGTQSNQTAIKALTRPADEIIVEAGAHLYNYEGGAPGLLSGVQIRPILGDYGVIHLEQIEEVYSPGDLHRPPTRLICLENTHNRAGGTVFPIDIMERITNFARERGILVHLDGARLFNASVASGVDVKDYARLADTVSICLSKGLGAPVGSCLSGKRDLIERARRVRKILGGGMRQAGILAAAGIYALENNVERLAEDHANAKRFAKGIADLKGLNVDVEHVDTNIVLIHLTDEEASSLDAVAELKERGVSVVPFGKRTMRAVTHLDVTRTDIDRAIAIFMEHFGA